MPGQLSGQPSAIPKKPKKPKKPPQDASDRQKPPKVRKPKPPESTLDVLDRLRDSVPRGTPTPTYTTKPTGTKKFKALQLSYARNLGHRLVTGDISKQDFDRSLKRMGLTVADLESGAGFVGGLEAAAGSLGFGETSKLLPGGKPSSDINKWMLGLEAGSVLPIGRAARLGATGIGGGIRLGSRVVGRTPTRTLQVGEKVQQMQGARSRLTRYGIEKPADAFSKWMMKEESKAAAATRKIFPTASAQARVAKQSAREQALEARIAGGLMHQAIHALPKQGSTEDVAHFWWAQVPKEHRNVETLKAVRGKQAEEFAELQSGETLARIQNRQAAVRAEIKALQGQGGEMKDIAPLLEDMEQLQILASDIGPRIDDVATSIAQLDQVIAKPPRLKNEIIDAVHNLSRDRRESLIGAGILDADRAAAREGIVSRWLGLDEGGEAFVGHRLGQVKGAKPSLMATGVGTGRVRIPEGVARENKLVLAKGGRLRQSTHVAAEDWQTSQSYRNAVTDRANLGQMGKPFVGKDGVSRIAEDEVLINPKGRALPPQWKTDELPRMVGASDDEIRAEAAKIVDGFMAQSPEQIAAMKQAALEAGVSWDELRVVKKSVVDRYYGQINPAARSMTKGIRQLGQAYDAAVDATAASIIFFRLGYIPKQIAQNLIMAVPHQGPFMLVNVPRGVQAVLDPELSPVLSALVGFSSASAEIGRQISRTGKVRGLPGKGAEQAGKIGDNAFRVSGFLHELAAEGVISKYSPYITTRDKQAILDLVKDTSPKAREILRKATHRGVESYGDFSRLTPTQRHWARRFLVIPGWLWAGSRYPVHFAATHPLRSGAIAYAAAGEPYGERIGLPQNRPLWEMGAEGLPYYMQGFETPLGVMRSTSLSPISTPIEAGEAGLGLGERTIGSYANPLAVAIWNALNRQAAGPYGAYPTEGDKEAWLKALERVAPNIDFIRDLISPPTEPGRYPEDVSRLGRLKREAGVIPIEIARGEIKKKKKSSSGPSFDWRGSSSSSGPSFNWR